MLPFIGRRSKAKTNPQSSEHIPALFFPGFCPSGLQDRAG
jgi:hypothetical protein